MFNSEEYAWKDVTVVLLGKAVTGIRSVKYSEKQEKEFVYGKGDKPVAIQKGNKSYSGEIKLLQSELEALIAASETNSILDIPAFDIIVTYAAGVRVITDVLKSVEFTESAKEIKQGDKFQEITLPVLFLDAEQQI
jgi:hypothetical protein